MKAKYQELCVIKCKTWKPVATGNQPSFRSQQHDFNVKTWLVNFRKRTLLNWK